MLGLVALVALLAGGTSVEDAGALLDVHRRASTPMGLAVLNLLLGSAIPSSWFVLWLFHRLKPRWLSSVAPRLRWRFLLACLPLSVVALVASLGGGAVPARRRRRGARGGGSTTSPPPPATSCW